ncbi:MAG: asparagine synthase (glutamine-hydrolyzing) [Alphaproteobacteria bacterium]
MCGVIAIYDHKGLRPDAARWRTARDSMTHRGPDDAGEYSAEQVWLGFRRLSILDLTQAGHQPMLGADGRVALVFNGQIYNYLDLRRELEARGHQFRSTCDTEVVLAAYLAWGVAAFERMRGMWAIVLWDARTQTLTVSRDRLGIKPLYLYRGKHLVFASEIKAVLALAPDARPNLAAVQRYVARGWLDHLPESLFDGIEHVPAASIQQWTHGRLVRDERFWSPPRPSADLRDPLALRETIQDACRRHMQSDVPVAAALSGGMDSSTIVSVLAQQGFADQLHTFSVRAPDIADESAWIDRTVATQGIRHEYVDIASADYGQAIDEMISMHDEPTFSAGQVNQYMMRRQLGRRGYKVLLVGDGGDEIMGGYAKCVAPYLASLIEDGDLASARAALRGGVALTGRTPREMLARLRLFFESGIGRRTVQEFRLGYELFAPHYAPDEALFAVPAHKQLADLPAGVHFFRELLDRIHLDFPIVLRNEDRNGMAHSIEVRPVFMDHTVIETAWRYPYRDFMQGGLNKSVLRSAMQGIVVPEVLANRKKFVRPGSATQLMYESLLERMRAMLGSALLWPELWRRDLAARFEADRARCDPDAAIVWMRWYQLQRWLALRIQAPAQAALAS